MNKVRKLIYIFLMSLTLNTFATGGNGGGGGVVPESVKLQGGTQGGGVLDFNPKEDTIRSIGGNGGDAHSNSTSKVDGGHEL